MQQKYINEFIIARFALATVKLLKESSVSEVKSKFTYIENSEKVLEQMRLDLSARTPREKITTNTPRTTPRANLTPREKVYSKEDLKARRALARQKILSILASGIYSNANLLEKLREAESFCKEPLGLIQPDGKPINASGDLVQELTKILEDFNKQTDEIQLKIEIANLQQQVQQIAKSDKDMSKKFHLISEAARVPLAHLENLIHTLDEDTYQYIKETLPHEINKIAQNYLDKHPKIDHKHGRQHYAKSVQAKLTSLDLIPVSKNYDINNNTYRDLLIYLSYFETELTEAQSKKSGFIQPFTDILNKHNTFLHEMLPMSISPVERLWTTIESVLNESVRTSSKVSIKKLISRNKTKDIEKVKSYIQEIVYAPSSGNNISHEVMKKTCVEILQTLFFSGAQSKADIDLDAELQYALFKKINMAYINTPLDSNPKNAEKLKHYLPHITNLIKTINNTQSEGELKLVLGYGGDPNEIGADGLTLLQRAILNNNTPQAEKLLQNRCINIEIVSTQTAGKIPSGSNALIFAAAMGNTKIVDLILDRESVRLDVKNDADKSAFSYLPTHKKLEQAVANAGENKNTLMYLLHEVRNPNCISESIQKEITNKLMELYSHNLDLDKFYPEAKNFLISKEYIALNHDLAKPFYLNSYYSNYKKAYDLFFAHDYEPAFDNDRLDNDILTKEEDKVVKFIETYFIGANSLAISHKPLHKFYDLTSKKITNLKGPMEGILSGATQEERIKINQLVLKKYLPKILEKLRQTVPTESKAVNSSVANNPHGLLTPQRTGIKSRDNTQSGTPSSPVPPLNLSKIIL